MDQTTSILCSIGNDEFMYRPMYRTYPGDSMKPFFREYESGIMWWVPVLFIVVAILDVLPLGWFFDGIAGPFMFGFGITTLYKMWRLNRDK